MRLPWYIRFMGKTTTEEPGLLKNHVDKILSGHPWKGASGLIPLLGQNFTR